MRPDTAFLAATASALELQLDRAGWGQPLAVLALVGTDLALLAVAGDPMEALRALAPPTDADALIVAHEDRTEDGSAPPIERRVVVAVARTGEEAVVVRRRGDRAVVDRAPSSHPLGDGGLLAAVRRTWGLPTRPTSHPVSAYFARGWVAAVAEAAERTVAPLTWSDIEALAPDPSVTATLTWDDVHRVAADGRISFVDPMTATWMDADMLAEHLAEVLPPLVDLLDRVRALVGDELADSLASAVGQPGNGRPLRPG